MHLYRGDVKGIEGFRNQILYNINFLKDVNKTYWLKQKLPVDSLLPSRPDYSRPQILNLIKLS